MTAGPTEEHSATWRRRNRQTSNTRPRLASTGGVAGFLFFASEAPMGRKLGQIMEYGRLITLGVAARKLGWTDYRLLKYFQEHRLTVLHKDKHTFVRVADVQRIPRCATQVLIRSPRSTPFPSSRCPRPSPGWRRGCLSSHRRSSTGRRDPSLPASTWWRPMKLERGIYQLPNERLAVAVCVNGRRTPKRLRPGASSSPPSRRAAAHMCSVSRGARWTSARGR